ERHAGAAAAPIQALSPRRGHLGALAVLVEPGRVAALPALVADLASLAEQAERASVLLVGFGRVLLASGAGLVQGAELGAGRGDVALAGEVEEDAGLGRVTRHSGASRAELAE